jgi:hypothetical protein
VTSHKNKIQRNILGFSGTWKTHTNHFYFIIIIIIIIMRDNKIIITKVLHKANIVIG